MIASITEQLQAINTGWQEVTLGGLTMAEVIEKKRSDCRTQMTGDGVRSIAALPFPFS
jgi:hypothetical protein